MGLRHLLIGTAVLLLAVQVRADTAEVVERSVRSIQTAFNKGDVDALKGLMTRDHLTILTYARFSNAADQLKVLAEFKFTEYKMTGLKVKSLTKDVALASYQGNIKGTYKAKESHLPCKWSRSGSIETENGCRPPTRRHRWTRSKWPACGRARCRLPGGPRRQICKSASLGGMCYALG